LAITIDRDLTGEDQINANGGERSLEVRATPQTVWRIWSNPATWSEWNPDVVSAKLDGPFGAGATGEMTTKAGGTHRIRIAAVELGRSFRLETSPLPLTRFAFTCRVAANSSGSTISQGLAMQGPLAPLFAPMMGKRIADSFGPILKGLATKAEQAEQRR